VFLKRLEIIGFKSFAERIGIDFVPGVTAVVGPNGSGKSNVTDAIRWVLGEQSAKSLRGAKMEDVIFAGSDSRKPLNFAEVTLILDNSNSLFPLDYTEISVSRRVFRSGESAYLLNGQQCRLKDITDVFMDSGLGKEAFSIISQGRVDEILNSRPEDRRSVFDEAAGVLKYKTRKKKAEHKLFETEDNLNRILDILKELESRMGPLQKSAVAAEKHAVLAEKTREADVALLNYDARNLGIALAEKNEQSDAYQKEKDRLALATQRSEESAGVLKEQLTLLDNELEQLQRKLVDVSAETEKWEGRRLLTAEKRRNANQQIDRIRAEITEAENLRTEVMTKLASARKNLVTSQLENERIAEEMGGISQVLKRSVKETENEIEDLKSTYIELLNEEATLRNDLKHTEERLVSEKSSSEKMSQHTSGLKERIKQLIAEKTAKESALTDLKKNKREAETRYRQSEPALREVEKELKDKQDLLQNAYNRQHEMQGRLRALESMEADFSGFYSGVKEVLIAKKNGKLSGINGAVAELITVDKEYVKAVETALGGAMQHIITSSEAEARRAIAYLKAKNAGRATFLPLDVMKSRKIQATSLSSVMRHAEYIGTADSLVQTDGVYNIITENLLGNVIVASTLAGASEIAKLLGYRYRIVTIDGDIVNAGGSLTGGGVKGQASVFTRKAELESLKVHLGQMASSINSASKTIGDTKMKVAELMQDTEQSRRLTEKLQHEITTAESAIRETLIAIASVESAISSAELGRRGSESTGSELVKKKEQLYNKHIQLKSELEKSKAKIEALERLAADRRNEEAALTARLTDLREQFAVLREQKAYQQTSIEDMERAVATTERKLSLLQEEMQYFTGGDEVVELSAEEISAQIDKAAAEKEAVEHAIVLGREKRTHLITDIDSNNNQLRKHRESVEGVTASLNEVNVGMSRLEVQYEAVTQRLLNEYGLYPDFFTADDFDEKATRECLEDLKRQLAAIGPVNPEAVGEFTEVTERYDFLNLQRNDLVEAKNTLHEAMSEMDTEMTHRFSATFNAVQNRFRDVYKEMFGGGDADLVLTQPGNLLETGVDIVARPPGKKLQNLSLLSGGERALTAIALLFSIIEVRPVPFCILDEVEAALDEANVIRYSKYLKKFSKKTQFIVITHRKGTMEGADVLYGITMQESGVSRLISVKLSEVPEGAIM
jgi:chromosome segregation protein